MSDEPAADPNAEAEVKETTTGKGLFVFKDGTRYHGEWKAGADGVKRKHGKGMLKEYAGLSYEGDWMDDKKHGHGEEVHISGNHYVGKYCNGVFEGLGTFTWGNGAIYEGEWKNGKLHGNGEFKDARGDRFQGCFVENHYQNKGGYFVSSKDDSVEAFDFASFVPRGVGSNPVEKILALWFAGMKEGQPIPSATLSLWKGTRKLKELTVCLEQVESFMKAATDSARGSLAVLVLIGPINRSLNGDTKAASTLQLATTVAKEALEKGHIDKVSIEGKIFFYDALARAEDKEISANGVKELQTIAESEDGSEEVKDVTKFVLEQCKTTTDLIEKFGRDPRWNDVMSREATEEESSWLKENSGGVENDKKEAQ